MRPMDQLQMYLGAVRRRMVASTLLRGAAIALGCALTATVALAALVNRFAFSAASLTWSRAFLFLAIAFAAAFAIVLPVLAVNRRRAVRRLEEAVPEFDQRLLTCLESPPSPVLDLLARDTMKIAGQTPSSRVVPPARMAGFGGAAAAALGALLWLVLAGPGYFGHSAALLWGATPRNGGASFYDIQVIPGDKLVRRKSNELISAHLAGFQSAGAKLKARYKGSAKWEEVAMVPSKTGGFEFLLASIPDDVEYYVEAGNVRSRQHKITVADLPSVKKIKVTYQYPKWTGLAPLTEDPGGDLRAIEGTEADLEIEFDRPLAKGLLALDDNTQIAIDSAAGTVAKARVPIRKEGAYHVAMLAENQRVRLSDDYFIEAQKESEPVIRLSRPGRDLKVSPIEEVTLEATAQDDFGVRDLKLHYSVNGAEEKTVAAPAGGKTSTVRTLIALEEFKLMPGDVVSVYATARDARTTARTDIYFLEAQPFEREYSQGQVAGGEGGGGGGEQNRIADRQKELIAATWNEIRDRSGNRAKAGEDAKFLSEVQAKLKDQALTLAQRMRARQLAGSAESFQAFAKDMEAASAAMGPAAERLKSLKWQEALPHEQQALQHLLRAEARFREIQVAFGNQGGGGGGGGRDLESLFDLELDTEKNQYETGQQTASSGGNRQQEIDEAMQKLEQLARRQQELAQQQNRQQQQLPEQRWQQEQLRREAEQLQRQMQQLAQQMGQQQGQSGQQGQQGQSGQSGQSGQQSGSQQGSQSGSAAGGQQSATQQRLSSMAAGRSSANTPQRTDPRIQRALDQLAQAAEDMRRANQPGKANNAESRRAAERLDEAKKLLGEMRREETSGQLDELSRRADQLAAEQRAFAEGLRQRYGGAQSRDQQDRAMMSQSREQNEQLAQEKTRLMEEYKKLERDLQSASRGIAGAQSGPSSKLREAIGNAQREEIGLKMKYMSEWLRRGLGPYAWSREAPVTSALEALRDEVKEAAAMGAGAPGQGAAGGDGKERALSQLEQVRQQLDRASRPGRGSAAGTEPGQASGRQGGQQPGQGSGQQLGQQPGQQAGQQGQGGQSGGGSPGGNGMPQGSAGGSGERQSGYGAMNTGDRTMPGGGLNAPQPMSGQQVQRAYTESLRELREMRQQFADAPETRNEIDRLIRDMQRLDPAKFPGNPALVDKMRAQVLPALEQLELRLRAEVDQREGGLARSGISDTVPAGYTDAVAEYFRRLSRGK